MNTETLRQIVSSKSKKLKQIHITWLCLNFVESQPESAKIVGCLWNTDTSFLINTEIFAKFINRLPNTINRGFRSHRFDWKKSSTNLRDQVPEKFDFKNFPDQLNWIQRKCEGFTKKTTELEAINWKYYHLVPKKSKIFNVKKLRGFQPMSQKKVEESPIFEEVPSIFDKNINADFMNDYFNHDNEIIEFSTDMEANDDILNPFELDFYF